MRAGRDALPRPQWSFWQVLPVAALLNTGVAGLLWWSVPQFGPAFAPIWWRSQAIGLSIFVFCYLGVRLLHRTSMPDGLKLTLPYACGAPLGYLLGNQLVAWVRGEPGAGLAGLDSFNRIAWLTTLLTTTFAAAVIWMLLRAQQAAAERARAHQLATEAQLRLLRAQLQPHMLFNTLANLRELMVEDVPAAQRMLDELITYLRGSLLALQHDPISLAQEFAHLRAYLELMALRLGPRLRWELDLPVELSHTQVPAMLLQPLVENAIHHGAEAQAGPMTLQVLASRGPHGLTLEVRDSGPGWGQAARPSAEPAARARSANDSSANDSPANDSSANTGGAYGLAHVRERVRQASAGRGQVLCLPNHPKGARVVVMLPAEVPAALPAAMALST